jgi:hypothetical protein
VHLASNLLVFSVRGLCKSTRFPTSNARSFTFGSLHIHVSSRYFSKFAMALSLSDSSRSFSSTSFGHASVSAVVHKLRYFISSSSTTSAPYINWNGVKFVALHTMVLWLHTTVGMTSAHLPFFSPSSIFLIASKIREFTLSTVPMDYGWYTNVNATFVLICWHKSLNIALSKYITLSTVICPAKP